MTLVTPLASLGLVNLVLSLSSLGSDDWSPPGPHLDSVNPVSTCASPGPFDCVPTWFSPGGSGSHMGLSCNWFLWSPPGLHLDLVTQVPTWTYLDPLTLVPTWTSPGPGDSLSNMDLTWIW